tara:strand:+ start:158 stop:325 length:168 start_codon:yes stop_codon:yes gene_type:complete
MAKKCVFKKMGEGRSFERAKIARSLQATKAKDENKRKKIIKDKEKRLKEWRKWWG